jgi:gliding motility-associated-like protein
MTTKTFIGYFLAALISMASVHQLIGQVVISTPALGFSQACASESFNSYNVTFSFSPENGLRSANQFTLELSDSSGSFDSPDVVFTSNPGEITTSPATINFALPETTTGEAYRLRVKASDPIATSAPSQPFAAYYKIQDAPFTINNLVDTGVYCAGGSYLLTIDNPGGPLNDSPLQYPNLTFNWYKETTQTNAVFVASGTSLSVSEPGTYFVETDYGTCTSNSFSNRVTVMESSDANEFVISSSLGNPYCSAEGATTLSAINGDSYLWFKDGELIQGATSQTLETSESGEYRVNVNLGACSAESILVLETTGFTASLDVDDSIMLEEDSSIWVTVTTDAQSPSYQWWRNGSIVSNEDKEFLEITEEGNYSVIVAQNEGCLSSLELSFRVTEAFPDVDNIPNLISPNNDGFNDTWVIPQVYTSGSNTEIKILSATGDLVFQTTDYMNNWPTEAIDFSNVNPVFYYIITPSGQSPIKGTISVIK